MPGGKNRLLECVFRSVEGIQGSTRGTEAGFFGAQNFGNLSRAI